MNSAGEAGERAGQEQLAAQARPEIENPCKPGAAGSSGDADGKPERVSQNSTRKRKPADERDEYSICVFEARHFQSDALEGIGD